jgi:acyl-CoA synthetase (AMP-forming)/AMP-acid ligase II
MVQYGAALAGLILGAVCPAATAHELEYVLARSRANGLISSTPCRSAVNKILNQELQRRFAPEGFSPPPASAPPSSS